MFTPPDNKEMTKRYRKDKGGICGQACLAVIRRDTIKNILNMWRRQGLEFKGYSGWKQLIGFLRVYGHNVKQCRGTFQYSPSQFYIARVQWIGDMPNKDKPFYGWKHWTEASAHTHFIVLERSMFFCNETGWDDYLNLTKYLQANNGIITSYLEIEKVEVHHVTVQT